MLSSVFNLRLQQLETNITRVLQLLNEYEEELLDEDDPGKKSKYRRRAENLKRQKVEYEEQFSELQAQLLNEQPLQVQVICNQLEEIDNKIEFLLDNQAILSQTLLLHFSPDEQALLLPLAQQLGESECIEMQAFLEAVETDQASGEEVQLLLNETLQLLKEVKARNLALPEGSQAVVEMINTPTVDTKHALKVSIPIIPFILAYEGELGLGIGINLKETWQYWKSKFIKNR